MTRNQKLKLKIQQWICYHRASIYSKEIQSKCSARNRLRFFTTGTEPTALIFFILHFTHVTELKDTYSLESWLRGSESPWSAPNTIGIIDTQLDIWIRMSLTSVSLCEQMMKNYFPVQYWIWVKNDLPDAAVQKWSASVLLEGSKEATYRWGLAYYA